MARFDRITSGGKAVGGGSLAPRSQRGNTGQANDFWRGGTVGPNASGGFAAVASTGLGYNYLEFRSTGILTVLSAGTFEIKSFGGGGAGWGGNGYNAFGGGGSKGAMADATLELAVGTYTVNVGTGSNNPASAPTNYYPAGQGGTSSITGFATTNAVGGTNGSNPGGRSATGATGTQVNTFIGGASLFKGAGGGNAESGIGGSGIGGNATQNGTAGSAAGNTASGGGGAGGAGQPNLTTGNAGSGGSGIVYVRWLA